MMGYRANILVVGQYPFEVEIARNQSEAEVVLANNPGTAYEEVAAFVKGTPHLAHIPVLLLTPTPVPIVVKAGIDPVHFGLVMMTATTLGSMTPPVGVAMYTVCGMLGTPMDEYVREALPLIAAVIVLIFAMAFVPQIVMFLPDLLM